MGFGIPIVAVPLLKDALARHVAFAANVQVLRSMGVRVLFDPAAPPDARMPPGKRFSESFTHYWMLDLERDGNDFYAWGAGWAQTHPATDFVGAVQVIADALFDLPFPVSGTSEPPARSAG